MATEGGFRILVIGAGPAGISAATAAARYARGVAMIDENPTPGGQIWRGEMARPASGASAYWLKHLSESGVEIIGGACVIGQPEPGVLLVETADGAREIGYEKLILATGARERFLPFPGWTLPGVAGAGGLQALVKAGLPVGGKTVVVAGTGPLLLAAAAYLHQAGARVPLIAEQAPLQRLTRFGLGLARRPSRLLEGAALRWRIRGTSYWADCWPVAASGDTDLKAVALRRGGRTWEEPCDYLACGFGLVPNLELPHLIGCAVCRGFVRVDDWQRTDVAGVYAAGEVTGIGGLELALAEGQVAGLAATSRYDDAQRLFRARTRGRRFQAALERTFSLRDELRELAAPDTIVCRCEDVRLARLVEHRSWRAAKLQTRCGMGPCQGRVCGPATEFLFGWSADSVRPPVFPARVSSLASSDAANH